MANPSMNWTHCDMKYCKSHDRIAWDLVWELVLFWNKTNSLAVRSKMRTLARLKYLQSESAAHVLLLVRAWALARAYCLTHWTDSWPSDPTTLKHTLWHMTTHLLTHNLPPILYIIYKSNISFWIPTSLSPLSFQKTNCSSFSTHCFAQRHHELRF